MFFTNGIENCLNFNKMLNCYFGCSFCNNLMLTS